MAGDPLSLVPAGDALSDAGEWVVFVGPHGPPSRRTLSRMRAAAGPDRSLVVAGPQGGRARDIDLEREPGGLPLVGSVFAFRTEVLRAHRLTMDPDLAPDLAGPLLAAEYLARLPRPAVVLVRSRSAGAGPVDWESADRYAIAPQRWAALLAGFGGAAPPWLQRLALEQLMAYLREDTRLFTTVASLAPDVVDRFHAAVASTLEHVDDETILGYRAAGVTDEMRLALLLGAQGRRGHQRPTVRRDAGRGLTRIRYLFAGEPPAETVTLDGNPVVPAHQKVRSVETVGRSLLLERIAWVPERAVVEVDRDGEVALRASAPGRIARYRRVFAENSGIAARVAADLRRRRRARRPDERERYRDAWLLMDRDTAAQDNAEHLYRYLLAHAPSVNAWFILARDSPDWDRLQGDGFRLLEFATDEYYVALLNCAHLISSQIDDYVAKPFYRHALGRPRWRFTFLQHGVIMHDLSRWLNRKSIDLFITSTPDEHRSIVGDRTPYVFTDLETVMTGLARHDRLLEVADGAERDWLVVMPTWRRELLADQGLGNERGLLDGFWESDFALAWRRVLESDRLRALCEREGWQLTFLPHPNMQDSIDTSPLPSHVVAQRFSTVDIQTVLARAAAFVTDYSSLAMEAAYLERPVVYYQFDRDAFYSGRLYQPGDWSYQQQGFGPVTESADAVVDALETIARGGGAAPEYLGRMQRTFPFRDGRCSERIVAAIRAITPG
jgi:hypothetical protein